MIRSQIDEDLAALTRHACERLALPRIAAVVLPEKMLSESEANAKHDKFGLVVLEDGSAGFFYRLLDVDTDKVAHYRRLATGSAGKQITDTLQDLGSDDIFVRGIALGAINASTTATYSKTGFEPPVQTKAEITKTANPNVPQKIGMVGYFAQQARQLVEQGNQLAVLELNEQFAQHTDKLEVTSNPQILKGCDVIYCTASTLINNTLESLLEIFDPETKVELVGPTAGCFPDPLFSRGVDCVGGSVVIDTETAIERVRAGKPWLESARKYSLTKANYPGYDALLTTS